MAHSTDWWIAGLLVCLAAGLRFWNLDRLGLTHFDEGSFTMAGRWLATLGAEGHPPQPPQAPPLTPVLQGVFFLLFGIRDSVAIALSATAGSLLVGTIYVAGRLWMGRTAGLLAALFLAGAEYHLIYSRMALTDSTFTLLFWVSLVTLFEGLRRENRSVLLAGALFTALCWNTKYHGFLPLLITALWLLSKSWSGSREEVHAPSLRWKNWLLAAVATGIGFLPWMVAVTATTGWREILVGLWDHSLGQGSWPPTSPGTLLFYLSRWLSPPLLGLAALGLAASLRKAGEATRFLSLAVVFFAFCALFYASFPRLLLPVVPGLCLLAALGVERLSRFFPVRGTGRTVTTGLGVLVVAWNLNSSSATLQLETDSYRLAAAYLESLRAPILSQMSKNFYFYEEAHTREIRWLDRDELEEIAAGSGELYIAVDPVFLRFPVYQAWLDERGGRLEKVAEFPIRVYEPARYQGIDPRLPTDKQPAWAIPYLSGEARIEVFRLRR